MNEKYCILENDGVALCVCKHKPCVLIKRMQEQYKNAINENRLLKVELEQYKTNLNCPNCNTPLTHIANQFYCKNCHVTSIRSINC